MDNKYNDKICLVYLEASQTRDDHGELVAEVGAVKFGEGRGYHTTTWGLQSKEWVAWYNVERMGLTEAESHAFHVCSMFGNWNKFESIVDRWAVKNS